jgi:hypothetical protein
MREIEDFISPLIEGQFPAFYRDEGKMFVAFVKAYYEWAESNLQLLTFEDATDFNKGDTITQGNVTGKIMAVYTSSYMVQLDQLDQFEDSTLRNKLTLCIGSSGGSSYIKTTESFNHEYLSRKLVDIRDIDTTIENFIVSFKNKYLPDIQFNTASNKRLFIKNALDFYRAKGTERAVDLFFKLIYGIEAGIYYPADDLLKPSDNEFVDVQYLEISPSESNVQLVGQTITGSISGQTAYADRLVRVKKGSRFIEVLYLESVSGNFFTGEDVKTNLLSTNVSARILGSLSSTVVGRNVEGYQAGDTISLTSGAGRGGKIRVDTVSNEIGIVKFELIDGGWGYSNTADVIGSQAIVQMNDLTSENTDWSYGELIDSFKQFETIKQNLVKISLDNTSAELSSFTSLSAVKIVDDAGADVYVGKVITSATTDFVMNYDTLDTTKLSTASFSLKNATETFLISGSGTAPTDISATANVIGFKETFKIDYQPGDKAIIDVGDTIYQLDEFQIEYASAVVDEIFADELNITHTLSLIKNAGTSSIRTNLPIYSRSTQTSYVIVKLSDLEVGVIDVVNIFYEGANTYGVESGSYSTSKNFSYNVAALASVSAYNNLQNYEDFSNATTIGSIDELTNGTYIDQTAIWGESADGATAIKHDTNRPFANAQIGSVEVLVQTALGSLYSSDPIFIIYEPRSRFLERYDFELKYSSADGQGLNFIVGETLKGATGRCRAVIIDHNQLTQTIRATRITLPQPDINDVAAGVAATVDFQRGESITGLQTGITTTLTRARELRTYPRTGLNAVVSSPSQSGNGFISTTTLLDSGFGYAEGETVNGELDRDPRKTSAFKLGLGKQGIAPGYFTSRKGFLSSDKYLHDNDFYQEYSYQVLTALPFETYRKVLIDVLHVSGTKPFGKYVGTTSAQVGIGLNVSTNITKSNTLIVNQNQFYTASVTFS